jgi:hypothetical protein
VLEVLFHVKGANVIEDGWVGGNASFRSAMMACIEVWKQFHSTFLVTRDNMEFFPMPVLHAILKARFEE